MLVVVCVHPGVDFGSPSVRVLAGIHGVCVQDSSEFDFQLNSAVLVEDPVYTVFVVCGSKDVGNEEFSPTGDGDGTVPEVGL